MITIPQLDDVSVIDDTDEIMVTHSDGTTEKISGADMKADIVKDKIENNNGNAVTVNAVSTIMASSTTITGPELGTGGNIKILFTADITGSDDTTGLSITYNSSAKAVKVAKDGSLVDFVAAEISAGTYKYLQAYTALELVYNGTYFIIVGNPVVLSDTDYTIYANGKNVLDPVDSVADSNLHPVTSNAVADALEYSTAETLTGGTWIDGKPIYRKVIDFGALPNATEKAVDHNITNLDKMLLIMGVTTDGGSINPLPYANSSNVIYSIMIYATNTQVCIRTGSDRRVFTQTYIILEYTKTS